MASSFIKKCEICGLSFNYTCGAFTQHLQDEHELTLKDYVIKFEYKGIIPMCACGYCNEEPTFSRGKFLTHKGEHKTYKWMHSHYIEKYGIPTCKTCGKEIGFNRLEPQQYCSYKCAPGKWNQEKCKKTLKENHGVDNPMQLESSKKLVSEKNRKNANKSLEKRIKTCQEKYGVNSVMQLESSKRTLEQVFLRKYGVKHVLQNEEIHLKQQRNSFKLHMYKDTDLYYQSSYEYHFLELCEKIGILHKIKNGNRFITPEHVYYTDFSLEDNEIEIKTTYIMKKQGGLPVLFAKKEAVEKMGKKYIFILDKDYSELFIIIKNFL